MIVTGSSTWSMGFGRNIGEVESDAEGIRAMRDLGRNMAMVLKALAAYRNETAKEATA
jgi:hypothetical protein